MKKQPANGSRVSRMSSHRLQANIVLLGVIAGLGVLYKFPPGQCSLYPSCPIFRLTHLYCPGCGATRALAALLHGQWTDAIAYNPLFVLALPLLLVFAAAVYWSAITERHVSWPSVPRPVLIAFLLITGIFTVVRNV
jgi:hypothetical protein